MTSLAVLGSGSWGTTFAKVLAHAGSEVQLWSRRPEVAYEINTFNRNTDYLPEVMLPSTVSADTDVHDVVRGKDAVFLALPSQELRANLREFASALDPGTVLVSLIKGVEKGTNMRMSSVIEEEIGWGCSGIGTSLMANGLAAAPVGLGGYSDAELTDLIHKGVRPNGQKLLPPMPSG